MSLTLGAIGVWLVGQAGKVAAKFAVEILFKKDLLSRLTQVSETWLKGLPDGERLASVEAIFPKTDRLDNPPPPPNNVLAKLERYEVPAADDWLGDLIHQWRWVQNTVEDPQDFFRLAEERAGHHLTELARVLELECQKDRELFQVASLASQKEQSQTQQVMQQSLAEMATRLGAMEAQIATSFDGMRLQVDSLAEPKGSAVGQFTTEIETAIKFTQDGQPDVAIAQLELLRKQNWNQLSDREKYRVLGNLGFAHNAKGEYSEAGKHFIESKTHLPNDEKARSLEAMGYFMLGDSTRAFELATAIRAEFPTSDLANDTWVRSAPDDLHFEEIESQITMDVRSCVETASALSSCAMRLGDFGRAEEYARTALTYDPNCPRLMEQLGEVFLNSERKNAGTQYSETPALLSPQKLTEAEKLFQNALEKTPQYLLRIRGRLRCHLAMTQRLLGKNDGVIEHIQAAFESDKHNPLFVAQYVGELVDGDKQDRALAVLREGKDFDSTGQVLLLLVDLLQMRNAEGDQAEAISLLSAVMPELKNLDSSVRAEIVERLVDLYCRSNQASDAESAIQSQSDVLAPGSFHALKARYFRRIGNMDAAQMEALEASQHCNPTIDRREIRRIALELSLSDLHEDAFPLWKQLVQPHYKGLDTDKLLYTAEKCGDDKFILEFCSQLRQNRIFDRDYFHCEINKLQEYNSIDRAIEAMRDFLQSAPDTPLAKEIRARLSHLAIIVGREGDAEFDPERLPSAYDVAPDLGLAVVEILSHGPNPLAAVKFAYELLRRNFNSHLAHKAMVMSLLFSRTRALKLPEFSVAAPGAAVRYRDHHTEREQWHIIEDGADPDHARHEYAPNHAISAAMIGLGEGQEFFLQRDNIQERKATIVDVWSKYKLQFNLCMEEWTNRFPEEYFVWQFHLKGDPADKSSFAEIFKTLDQREADIKQRDELYRNHPFSVTNYAMMIRCTVLEAVQHLGSQSDLPIRCCTGSKKECQDADEALAEGKPIVLDGSALATLFVTRTFRHLRSFGRQFVVSEGTFQEWRRRYLEKLNSPREGGFMVKKGDQYVFGEETPEAIEQRLGEFKEFIDTIKGIAQLESGFELCSLGREIRRTLIDFIGRPAAETIAIAHSKQLPIWTDDMVVAVFGHEHCAVPRVWTDAVFRWATAKKLIASEERTKLMVELVRLGFFHTRLDLQAVIQVAKDAHLNVTDQSLAALVAWFSNPFTMPDGILRMSQKLLPEFARLSQTELPVLSETLITQVLNEIAKRRDGPKIIEELRQSIDRVCGFEVVIANALKQSIDAWVVAQFPYG